MVLKRDRSEGRQSCRLQVDGGGYAENDGSLGFSGSSGVRDRMQRSFGALELGMANDHTDQLA